MALADLQAFIVERLQQVDSTTDLSSGSPYDVQVVQPILRRLGSDPFSVDIGSFIQTLLNQQFPDLPTKEGDAITDLLIKTAIVLWNPIVREITRVANGSSFKDPTILTLDEAESLGANLFATRETGDFSRGVCRIYFSQPQNCSASPANFVTEQSGLHFFPTETQSIRVEEMILNREGPLYYFDINLIAEFPGDQYNIGPDQLVTIANLASAIRITNKVRFRFGVPDETAVDFVGRIDQELTERSLVTQRGIVAKVTKEFPEATRLAVIGFNDPEMGRDIITGGGLGPVLSGGVGIFAEADGENAVTTRRVSTSELGVDFTALIGATGQPITGYTLTLHAAYPFGSLPLVRDLTVKQVVDPHTLDLEEQVLSYTATAIAWTLRKRALTLSGIPGGILFPDNPNGTVTIPDNQVHVGGATDIYVRGTDFDASTLVLDSIVDDNPLLRGVSLNVVDATDVQLLDYILGTNYSFGDATYKAFESAASSNLSLQILDPPNAGSYRILAVLQVPGSSPIITLSPALNIVAGNFRWRVSSTLLIDLVEPKETKVSGADLRTVQGSPVVDTGSGVDFSDFGVAPNDILRITTGGLVVGDYVVQTVLSPLFTKVQVDRNLPGTVNDAKYSVFRANKAGGIVPPFVRIDSIDLLDTSSQPVGSKIPYALPVDVQSHGFANVARGVKFDLTDGMLGIVSDSFPGGANVDGETLTISWAGQAPFVVTFSGGNPVSVANMVTQINTFVTAATLGLITRLAVPLDSGTRFGLLPVGPAVTISSGSARSILFGFTDKPITSRDINSAEVFALGGWAALRPALDVNFDVASVVDGLQVGFYGGLVVPNVPFDFTKYDPLRTDQDYNPEVRRHILVGARSLGTVRVYFLDPTSFEVDPSALFTLTGSDGSRLNFFPDPTNTYQSIPPLPSGTKPIDGETGGALATHIFQSLSTDFIAKGIQPGDTLSVDFIPLTGSVVLGDPVAGLNAKTLTLSINGGLDKAIIFIHDSGAILPADVTRQSVADQINKIVGQTLCTITAGNQLEFNPDASVVVRGSNVVGSANALLGFSVVPGVDQSNDSPDKGDYFITAVGPGGNPNQLQVGIPFPTGAGDTPLQQFKVLRAGLQRISSTSMAKNVGTAGLYFFDVQLISQGTGDQYNIGADLQMTVTGSRGDGYYLTTVDPDLTFSPIEKPQLHLSRSILGIGVTDDPDNATQLAGQNIQLNYERSSLVNNVNNFALSDTERVINQSPLARHLIPYFVRFALTYSGGSKEDVLIPDIMTFIQGILPADSLASSDLDKLASTRGARTVDQPIDLIAVIHNFDRTITVERSQDRLNTGRLAAFIPDVLTVKRRIA